MSHTSIENLVFEQLCKVLRPWMVSCPCTRAVVVSRGFKSESDCKKNVKSSGGFSAAAVSSQGLMKHFIWLKTPTTGLCLSPQCLSPSPSHKVTKDTFVPIYSLVPKFWDDVKVTEKSSNRSQGCSTPGNKMRPETCLMFITPKSKSESSLRTWPLDSH